MNSARIRPSGGAGWTQEYGTPYEAGNEGLCAWHTRQLWSLWDMINLPIGKLTAAGMRLTAFGQMVTFALGQPTLKQVMLGGDDAIAELIEASADLVEAAQVLGMPVTLQAARAFSEKLKALPRQGGKYVVDRVAAQGLDHLVMSLGMGLRVETEARVSLILPPDKLALFEQKQPPFGPDVADKFKGAIYDINEAAKCIALGRSTAAVYHLMRVVERALRAINLCLNLPIPDNSSWGIWLKQIRDERVKRGDRKWSENDYFQDVYSRLDAIKDAQRDPTMHVQTIHTEEEAALIYENTKAFMKKIASRMDEKGFPEA